MDRREPLIRRRLAAVLELRGITLAEICRRIDRTPQHLNYILRGDRPLKGPLLEALREAAGPEGWAFANGEIDTLRDEAP